MFTGFLGLLTFMLFFKRVQDKEDEKFKIIKEKRKLYNCILLLIQLAKSPKKHYVGVYVWQYGTVFW